MTMQTIRAVMLHPDRLVPFLPLVFGALFIAAAALHVTLLPVKPLRLEIPSGITIGIAPQESTAPPAPAAPVTVTPLTPVLPQESIAPEAAPTAASPSVAMAPPDIEGPAAGAAAGAASPLLGLPGSGNLHLRTTGTQAISTLVANLMETLRRLRARSAARPVHHPLALTPLPQSRREPTLAKESPVPAGLGGPAARRGDLGGVPPLAQRFAPAIDGASFKRKY
jgi:hypothetical protein